MNAPGRRARALYDFWGRSRLYDRLIAAAFLGREHRARRCAVAALELEPGDQVLDIGTGTGAALPLLAECVGPRGRVIAADISPGMLERAKRRSGGLSHIEFVEADAAELPFADATFDAVLSTFGLSAVSDGRAVSADACRVLRPGGRIAVLDAQAVQWPVPLVGGIATRLAAPALCWHHDRDFAGLLAGCRLDVAESRLGSALVLVVARKPAL